MEISQRSAPANGRTREWLFGAITLAIGFALAAVIAEVVFRLLPVRDAVTVAQVDAAHPILHHDPNLSYTWSMGPRMSFPVHGRTNNVGWVSAENYDSTSTSPLLSVVGDSYVEALMVPDSETMSHRLRVAAGPERRVYSFGISGAALSQYLAEANYARQTFRPSALVVIVVGNDFDESLQRYIKSAPGLHTFVDYPDSTLQLRRNDFTPNRARRIIRHSAVARYLFDQAGATRVFDGVLTRFHRRPTSSDDEFTGNSETPASAARIAWSKAAIRMFLCDLPVQSGLSASQIVLVLDGVRPELDNGTLRGSGGRKYFEAMRDYLRTSAEAAGFAIVDMQPVFARDFTVHHRAFEFPSDGHWNGYAQRLVAESVESTTVFRRFASGR